MYFSRGCLACVPGTVVTLVLCTRNIICIFFFFFFVLVRRAGRDVYGIIATSYCSCLSSAR